MRHAGKVAIVTGAARGIGLACAERLIDDGAQVLLADINGDAVQAQADRLGRAAAWWSGDLAVADGLKAQVDDLLRKAVATFGRVDILINNAGIIHLQEFMDFGEHEFDRVLRLNLKAPFLLGQAAARAIVKQGTGGSIINMSSINAVLAIPTSTAYAVSKGGIMQLTKVMAVALAPHGIRVNAIGPGTILTDMVKSSVMASAEQRQTILSRTPLGRCGEPAEIASVASFLASDDASYIIGQTIYPDGGRLILNYTVPVREQAPCTTQRPLD